MKKIVFITFLSLPLAFLGVSQNIQGIASYHVKKSNVPIKIDGRLDEESWKIAEKGGNFFTTFPTDAQKASDDTEFMITYDDQNLYVGVICHDMLPGETINNTLRRDFTWFRNDNISFYVDPYNDKSNGFTFQVTPDNVQREGLVVLGGMIQDDWDNKWYSNVTTDEEGWNVEIAIPFKSIRYNSIPNWNIQFIRNNQKRNERSTWINVPQQFRASDMTYTGSLIWDVPPPEAGKNLTVIPYVIGTTGRNFEDNESSKVKGNTGFDAKVGLSNSLNLDLTFNPDFSQVEIDEQVTNLQRFEISFPERRQFFLENQDLFAQNGFRSTRPFFSRRIGIQGSGSTQRNISIIGGARVSGKIGKNWRIGMLDIVTNEDVTTEEISPVQNYAVAVVERQLFKRSRISAVFVGRTNLGNSFVEYDSSTLANTGQLQDLSGNTLSARDTLITLSAFNYVYGLDYNLATPDNRWEGNAYYHFSADPVTKRDAYTNGLFLRYQTTRINSFVFFNAIGEGYNAEVGFVRRTGINRSGTRTSMNFFTEGAVQRHGPTVGFFWVFDPNWKQLDQETSLGYEWQFLSSARLEYKYSRQRVRLIDSFDPSGSDGQKLSAGDKFIWNNININYESDNRKKFLYEIGSTFGSFYNGERFGINGGLLIQFQPILQVGLDFNYNKVTLPEPYSSSELWLISPQIDLTLTNTVFFTSFLQYNTQAQNFGHNSRLQWRFKPVSDLFIVYTDNYTTPTFNTKNRTLVIKLSYWLNL